LLVLKGTGFHEEQDAWRMSLVVMRATFILARRAIILFNTFLCSLASHSSLPLPQTRVVYTYWEVELMVLMEESPDRLVIGDLKKLIEHI